jgi:NAD(P)-dependent dehydrogenase (short-subunit alcohol dehydrogenase family)
MAGADMAPRRLDGELALVTGAGRGTGRAIAADAAEVCGRFAVKAGLGVRGLHPAHCVDAGRASSDRKLCDGFAWSYATPSKDGEAA